MRFVLLLSLLGLALSTPLGPQLPASLQRQLVHRNDVCAHSRSSNPKLCCHEFGIGCTPELLPLYECASDSPKIFAKPFCCSSYKVGCADEGEACVSSQACLDKVCVFSDLSSTAESGTCMKTEKNVHDCSLDYCSRYGADGICHIKDMGATTCGAWHAFQLETGEELCSLPCTKLCRRVDLRPVASNGVAFCSVCALQLASCESGFKIYGPIEPEASDEPEESAEPIDNICFQRSITKFDAYECCTKVGTFCPKEGETCSSGGSLTKPPPCEGDLKCVLKNFGFPALDVADEGTCMRAEEKVSKCELEHCSRAGAEALCAVTDRVGTLSTCGSWATRSDGVAAADCEFACSQQCREPKLTGSDGKSYCSLCALKSVSCVSNFEIYGPVE